VAVAQWPVASGCRIGRRCGNRQWQVASGNVAMWQVASGAWSTEHEPEDWIRSGGWLKEPETREINYKRCWSCTHSRCAGTFSALRTTRRVRCSLVRWCLGPLGVVGSAFTTFSSSGCCHSSDDFQTTAHLRPLHWRRLSRTERTPVATVSKSLGAGTWVQLPPRGIEDV
jgi:hypothetical protein